MKKSTPKSQGRKVKAWAIVSRERGNIYWTRVNAVNSKHGSSCSMPAVFTHKKEALQHIYYFKEEEAVVPCTITYSLPQPLKKTK